MKYIEMPERLCYDLNWLIYYRSGGEDKMDNTYTDGWIGIDEAAKYMDVTKDTVRNWIKKTDIPAHKIGKLWKFKRSELDSWIKSGNSAID